MIGEHVPLLSDQDLRPWGVSRRMAIACLVVPFIGAIAVALTFPSTGLYRFLTAEDHVFEWAQFACYVVAAIAGGVIAGRLLRARHRAAGLSWTILSVALFSIAGEEIAWGQRLFGLETPDLLERLNRQQEITVHNVGGASVAFDIAFVALGLLGAGSALWYRKLWPPRRADLVDLFVPPVFLAGFFLLVPLYKVVRAIMSLGDVASFIDYGEYIELCLAVGVAAFCALSVRRWPPSAVAARRPGTSPGPGRQKPRGSAQQSSFS